MGKPAYPLRYKLIAFAAAGLLACGLAPLVGFAQESVAGSFTPPGYEDDARSASPNSALMSDNGGPILASTLTGSTTSIVSTDVALDASDPVIGSFTVDGLTYAVGPDGLALVAIGASAVSDGAIAVPASVTYDDVPYPVTAVGPYAFYLSGAASVELPASVTLVDDRAFRSSDVERVEVATDNPNLTSYDGALYSADKSRLLLIPEGRAGAVLLPCEAEVAESSVFSHCSLVDAIDAGEGGAAFASWDGLLYDASGTTLLRVPAGATEITIRDGCTTIAAGAMEGCANLERINAPASVTSISPDVFTSIPTVSLPVTVIAQVDSVAGPLAGPGYEGDARSASADSPGAEGEAPGSAPQLTAMVALSSADDDLPEVDPSSIEAVLSEGTDALSWKAMDMTVVFSEAKVDLLATAAVYSASSGSVTFHAPIGYAIDGYFHLKQDGTIGGTTTQSGGSVTSYYYGIGSEYVVAAYDNGSGMGTYYSGYSWAKGNVFCITTGLRDIKGALYEDSSHSSIAVLPYSVVDDVPLDLWWFPETFGEISIQLDCLPDGGSAGRFEQAGWSEEMAITIGMLDADNRVVIPVPVREGMRFAGWQSNLEGLVTQEGSEWVLNASRLLTAPSMAHVLTAQWERVDFDIGFDVDSEPGDVDYPADAKDDQKVSLDDGHVSIEDPKRPGYVFEGWVIPNAGGTEAVDQDLVYQGDDKKWYVDASKLPDYAGDDGRVELTARWTSVISVDVPSSVTFYADLATQGQQSREGAASGGKSNGAFGQNKLSNQSQVDLRVVGLESSAVKTEGSILGADSILKKANAATPSSSTQKLLSLYPSTKQWTAKELQDPDAVGGDKATTAVDFDLDDILLEKSFKADDFTIPVGETLNMGYRLNLEDTGTVLDYDKLSTLSEGQSASIANVSYCFAADALPSDWDEPLWIENPDRTSNPAKYLLLKDIKEAANDLSANGTSSQYYSLYKNLLDKQVTNNGNPGAGPYFQLQVDGRYLPLQLIGICQDTKSDGTGKAGLTFQLRDIYAVYDKSSNDAGSKVFNACMNSSATTSGGWNSCIMRNTLRSAFWNYLSNDVRADIVEVDKYQQLYMDEADLTTGIALQKSTNETVWLPSTYEVYGASFANYNDSEAVVSVAGYTPFQYMAYEGNAGSDINRKASRACNGQLAHAWLRSSAFSETTKFDYAHGNGTLYCWSADNSQADGIYPFGPAPCFCL